VDNDYFAIPPGSAGQEVKQCATFDSDSLLLSLTPHMHHLGKDARFEVQRPGQAAETLLFVPKYDFNWQLKYLLQDPVFVPKGTRLIITFHYDNSANNRSNPDPNRTVRWGEPSEEEMMSGWIDYIQAPLNTTTNTPTDLADQKPSIVAQGANRTAP
jgi:Copper type II ascorbate-dependent monooxygenase, C-terminal domain